MRAEYLPYLKDPKIDQIIEIIEKDKVHHLANVIRLRKGEKVLLLNGEGLKVIAETLDLSKKMISLKVLEFDQLPYPKEPVDLFLCMPKKATVEECLKLSCELGISEVHLIDSEFSAREKFKPTERLNKIVESALKQSNNPFLPKIHLPKSFNDFDFAQYDSVFLFTLKEKAGVNLEFRSGRKLIIIGPEGGLSDSEETFLMQMKDCFPLKLNTPILRTPTALCSAIGYLNGSVFTPR